MYRVLIIDDEPWSRNIVRELGNWDELKLEISGEAEDGSQGMRLMKKLDPDIVITDMRMPGIEGVELLRAINEQFPDIKIIVMSGYNDFIFLKQAIRSRAMEYLLKPVDPEELNNVLYQCVKALNEAGIKKETVDRTAQITFKDSNSLDMYLSLRQQILWHILECDKPSLLRKFEKLAKFLENNLPESSSEGVISEVSKDLILMLKEFMNDNEPELEDTCNYYYSEAIERIRFTKVSEAMIEIGFIYGTCMDEIENYRKNGNRIDIEEIKRHIDKNFTEPISLDTISKYFFVSREHLSRLFKASSGENISDFITRKRMEKARELIVDQRLAIKHAAEIVGYEDIAYFYRVFKKYFGITPGDLRKV